MVKGGTGPGSARNRQGSVYTVRLILAIAILCLLVGAGLHLWRQGPASPSLGPNFISGSTLHGFLGLARTFAPTTGRFWMEIGLLMILAGQVLRLGMVAWRFLKARDGLYLLMTLFLLGLVLHSFLL